MAIEILTFFNSHKIPFLLLKKTLSFGFFSNSVHKQVFFGFLCIKKRFAKRRFFIYHNNYNDCHQRETTCPFYIYKNQKILQGVSIYKNPDTSQRARQFPLRFYIQKSGHFALRKCSLNFWNWQRGRGAFLYAKKCTLSCIFICQEQCIFAYVFINKNPDTLRSIYIYINNTLCVTFLYLKFIV